MSSNPRFDDGPPLDLKKKPMKITKRNASDRINAAETAILDAVCDPKAIDAASSRDELMSNYRRAIRLLLVEMVYE